MSERQSSDDILEVIPASGKPLLVCSHCGGRCIVEGVHFSQSAEAGTVGIVHEATGRFLGVCLLGSERLHADLCQSCGTLTRFYVKVTDRKWSV
jgi:hypothetical protein